MTSSLEDISLRHIYMMHHKIPLYLVYMGFIIILLYMLNMKLYYIKYTHFLL